MKSISSRLFDAVCDGDLDTTRELLQGTKSTLDLVQEANSNVNDRDYAGQTPLYQACLCGSSEKTENSIAIVKFLLTNGANVQARTWSAYGDTALHVACRSGNSQKAQELLNHGADVNAQDNYGETPLLQAWSYGCIDLVIQLLLANNADRHIKRKAGRRPMLFPSHDKQRLLQKRVFESCEKLALAVSTFDDTQQHEMTNKKRKFTQQGRETVRLNPRLSQHQHALAIKALLLVRKLPVHEVAYEILGFLSPCAVEKMVLPTV